jgi:hypothetical protein
MVGTSSLDTGVDGSKERPELDPALTGELLTESEECLSSYFCVELRTECRNAYRGCSLHATTFLPWHRSHPSTLRPNHCLSTIRACLVDGHTT